MTVILILMVELKLLLYVQNLLQKKNVYYFCSVPILKILGIKTTLKIRDKDKDRYRIRLSKTSLSLVRNLITPYMHKDFMYKLGE